MCPLNRKWLFEKVVMFSNNLGSASQFQKTFCQIEKSIAKKCTCLIWQILTILKVLLRMDIPLLQGIAFWLIVRYTTWKRDWSKSFTKLSDGSLNRGEVFKGPMEKYCFSHLKKLVWHEIKANWKNVYCWFGHWVTLCVIQQNGQL